MAQVFFRASNTIAKVTLLGGPLLGAFVLWLCLVYARSSYGTGAGEVRVQPVPFSHQHHVGDLGIDCRYCQPRWSDLPMRGCRRRNLHELPFADVGRQRDARAGAGSYRTDKSLHWKRVYNLPGFVYFDHSIHIHKGVGCTTCHGRIDEMPLTFQKPSLLMEWCLDCHRNPEPQSSARKTRYSTSNGSRRPIRRNAAGARRAISASRTRNF